MPIGAIEGRKIWGHIVQNKAFEFATVVGRAGQHIPWAERELDFVVLFLLFAAHGRSILIFLLEHRGG